MREAARKSLVQKYFKESVSACVKARYIPVYAYVEWRQARNISHINENVLEWILK
jgi:hypothetical protein